MPFWSTQTEAMLGRVGPSPKAQGNTVSLSQNAGDFGAICSITVIICLRTGRVELQEGGGGIPPQLRKGWWLRGGQTARVPVRVGK